MTQTLKAGELPIRKILSDDFAFTIPPYQRPYAWTTEQVGELLDDLLYAVNHDGDSPYFLGSIVLIKRPDAPDAQVVDGQQRITTLTILLCVMREIAQGNDGDLFTPFILEEANALSGTQARYRLSLRDRDRNFFRKAVQESGRLADFLERDPVQLESDMRRRIQINARFLRDRLASMEEKERRQLGQFVIQRCFLVVVSASDEASAYRIFAVMNDRGLDLSPTDILKAEIIGALPESAVDSDSNQPLREVYTKRWEVIEEDLGREDFRDLFGHIRTIYAKDKARGALNQEFRDSVLSRVPGTAFVDKILTPLADAYVVVTRSAYRTAEDAKQINVYLDHLNRLDNADWVPPAMLFFRRYADDHESLAAFIRDLERLAYVFFVTRADVNHRIKRYAEIVRTVEEDGDLFSGESPLCLRGTEAADALAAIDGPIYDVRRVRMPLALRLDSLLSDEGATYDHAIVSLEHVLPQNPEAGSEWSKTFSDDNRAIWTDRLANLVLLSRRKNAQAQNFDFERKKKEYFQRKGISPFALTTQVLNEKQWTPAALTRRQETLVAALAKEWRLS